MEEKKLNSLIISGMGTYGGGEFDRVNISGSGKITGAIKCDALDVSGSAKLEEDITCNRAHVSGSCKVGKNMNAGEIVITGSYKQEGTITSERVEVSGMVKIKQCLNATKLYSTGMLTVEGDINGEEIKNEGMVNCSGLINCEHLEVLCIGGCKLNEVGAATISVKEQSWNINKLISLFVPKLTRLSANVMEGDDIYLESSDVKVIRGRNIKLGRECHIDTIEYSGTFEKDEASTVTNLVKVEG